MAIGASSVSRRPLNRSRSVNISISWPAAANAYGTSVVRVARMMIFVNVSVSEDW